MSMFFVAIFYAGVTIAVYLATNSLYLKYRWIILSPVLATTTLLVCFMLLVDISYERYMIGGQWIGAFLGPAVVALAVPLYKHSDLLKKNLLPIAIGVGSGTIAGMMSGVLLAMVAGFSTELVLTILPKSMTSPVAMQLSEGLGGISSLAAVFVMIAGFVGIIFGPSLLKILRIDSSVGRGLGLGTAAHGLGTAKAFEYGPEDASMSSVAMTLSAVFGSFLGPVVVWLWIL